LDFELNGGGGGSAARCSKLVLMCGCFCLGVWLLCRKSLGKVKEVLIDLYLVVEGKEGGGDGGVQDSNEAYARSQHSGA